MAQLERYLKTPIMYKQIVLLLAAMLAVSSPVFAQGFMDQDIVKVHGSFSTDSLQQGKEFKLALVLDIKKGMHINANTPDASFPVKADIDPVKGIEFAKPRFPEPEMKAFGFSATKLPVYEGKVVVQVDGKVDKDAATGLRAITGQVNYQACDDNSCYAPTAAEFEIPVKVVAADTPVKQVNQGLFEEKTEAAGKGSQPVDEKTAQVVSKIERYGLPFIFLAGVLLCLSPCVFPMIPVIVGYFGGQGQGRKAKVSFLALLFVVGLALTNSALGVAAAFVGASFANVMAHPAVPIVVVVVLVALALSLFGLYEIPVPNFIASRSQARSGALGALMMGLLFGIVATPCLGPVVLALLVVVAKGASVAKAFSMFMMLSLGLGLPFFFLAIFSGSLARMPKPGMWMVAVRKIFGFLLLGAALYYIEQFLPKSVANNAIPAFLVITGIYWLWLERSTREMRMFRRVQQAVALCVAVAGVWFIFSPSEAPMTWKPYTEQSIEAARTAGKPVVIDFTARWCNPCKELEHKTFTNHAVKKEAKRFVRLSVDLTRKSAATDKIAAEYRALRPPVIVILDSTGAEQDRIIGFVGPEEFLKRLKAVK